MKLDNRNPIVEKKVVIGHKLYDALVKIADKQGATVESVVAKRLWGLFS